jgi:hypothetical protein
MEKETFVWTLTRTEYAGQCTGFSSERVLLGIFTTKPDLKTAAPYLGSFLTRDIGQAIAEVSELLDRGNVTLRDLDFDLDRVQLNKQLKL